MKTEFKDTARAKANQKWLDENKERANYLRSRSAARSFIRKKATEEDLVELVQLIEQRKIDIKNKPTS